MADTKYKLKGKYNGVYGYTNEELTDKKAEALIKKHPRGINLFSVLPEKLQKSVDDAIAESTKILEDFRKAKRAEVKAEQDKQAAKIKADSTIKTTAIDLQNEKEALAIKAIAKEELELRAKIEARLIILLSWDRSRLVKKAKSLNITSTGSVEELAKRIHKKEQ